MQVVLPQVHLDALLLPLPEPLIDNMGQVMAFLLRGPILPGEQCFFKKKLINLFLFAVNYAICQDLTICLKNNDNNNQARAKLGGYCTGFPRLDPGFESNCLLFLETIPYDGLFSVTKECSLEVRNARKRLRPTIMSRFLN